MQIIKNLLPYIHIQETARVQENIDKKICDFSGHLNIFWETEQPQSLPSAYRSLREMVVVAAHLLFEMSSRGLNPILFHSQKYTHVQMYKDKHNRAVRSTNLSTSVCACEDLEYGLVLEWAVITSPALLSCTLLCLIPAGCRSLGDRNPQNNLGQVLMSLSCTLAKNAKRNFSPI